MWLSKKCPILTLSDFVDALGRRMVKKQSKLQLASKNNFTMRTNIVIALVCENNVQYFYIMR